MNKNGQPYSGIYTQLPVNDALVTVSQSGTQYTLVPVNDSGIYANVGVPLNCIAGHVIDLNCQYKEMKLTATTTIPSKPQGFSISIDTIMMQKIEQGGPPPQPTNPIGIDWFNLDNSTYYLSIQNIENNPEFTNYMVEQIVQETGDDLRVFTTAPTNGDNYQIDPLRDLYYFGAYRIVLYHINAEYENLLNQTTGVGSKIADAESNIINGRGIFTGVATDTLYLEVIKI